MADNKKILVVDDESSIRQLIKIFLSRYHYDVLEAASGKELFAILEREQPDLIVLDLMLPDTYGVDACKIIRETSSVPIIMLTAVQGEMNTVLGFEAGADDYVEKPFSAHVLLARIQAILRRTEQGGGVEGKSAAHAGAKVKPAYKKAIFASWTYAPEDASLEHLSGRHIFLTKNECALLQLFLDNHEAVLSRDTIAEHLNVDINDAMSRAIDVQISRLRNKLKDKSQNNLVKSIRNKGYLLSVPVKFV
jgi:two-component system OmpR family response regulator